MQTRMTDFTLKLDLSTTCFMGEEQINQHIATTDGLPRIEAVPPHGRKLAVCGAGPSLAKHLKTLRNWDGDIWAINSTPAYLRKHGIRSILFTVDPDVPEVINLDGVDEALLWVGCDPRLREKFDTVRLFEMAGDGPTSICRAPFIADRLGYRDVTLFGAEGSFGFKTAHVDIDEEDEYPYVACIHADGGEFLTTIPLLSQTTYLASYIRQHPEFLKEECGGLLRAIVKAWEWKMVAMTQPLIDQFLGSNDFGGTTFRTGQFQLREGAHA